METKKKHSEEVEELNHQIDTVFSQLPQIGQNSIQDAIDQLLLLEKKSRLLLEPTITTRVTDVLLDLCFDRKDFGKLNVSIKLLSKRRSQHEDVIAAIVKKSISYLAKIDDFDTRMTLLQTLLDTSEGKIFLEGERAFLLRRLMEMRESRGDLEGAASASREIQVEVCNALSSREKAEFLIEQIRLNQLVDGWIRVPLLLRKMNVKVLKEEKMEELLEQFINLCIVQHVHDNDLKELFHDHEQLLTLARLEENDEIAREVIPSVVVLAVLMPFDTEQQQIIRSLTEKYARHWKYLPAYRTFLQCFAREELLRWPLPVDTVLRQTSLFTEERWGEHREIWYRLLRQRVIEHNIRVIGKNFTCATIARIAVLLQLTEEEAEEALAAACQSQMLWLKMDRMQRTVNFQKPQNPEHVLSSWAREVKDVMGGLDHVVYLIEKEKMMKEVNQL